MEADSEYSMTSAALEEDTPHHKTQMNPVIPLATKLNETVVPEAQPVVGSNPDMKTDQIPPRKTLFQDDRINYNMIFVNKIASSDLESLAKSGKTIPPVQVTLTTEDENDCQSFWLASGLTTGAAGLLLAAYFAYKCRRKERERQQALRNNLLHAVDNNPERGRISIVNPRAVRNTETRHTSPKCGKMSSSDTMTSCKHSSLSSHLRRCHQSAASSNFSTRSSTNQSKRHHHHISRESRVPADRKVLEEKSNYCTCKSYTSSSHLSVINCHRGESPSVVSSSQADKSDHGPCFRETEFGGIPISLRCANCGGFRRDGQQVLMGTVRPVRSLQGGEEEVIQVDVHRNKVDLYANGIQTRLPLKNCQQ